MTAIQVKCPHCGTLTFFSSENPSRPFCSDRCRLIDLGEWASGGYTIPIAVESGTTAEAELLAHATDEDHEDQNGHISNED